MDPHAISVIIPTKANPQRRALLKRAIQSVLAQENVYAVPIVVVNGSDRDPELMSELVTDRRLRVTTMEQADLPTALRVGRESVETDWFAELDDDDVFMPRALFIRKEALEKEPEFDVVVTNGIRRGTNGDKLHFVEDISIMRADPLRAMRRHNWLLPGSWLCRAEEVGPEIFTAIPKFRECTYLGLQFALKHRIKFLDCPTIIYHTDTPQSESKSQQCALGVADATRQMLELDLPLDLRNSLRLALGGACSANANYYLEKKDLCSAWSWYCQSLRGPGKWRRVLFARRFAYALFRS